MKISQYNWNWWFVMTCILLCIGLIMSLCSSETPELSDDHIAMVILIISSISLLPCLYIGMKPNENTQE